MLSENLLKEGKVVGLKLVTGEEVIGKLSRETKSDLYFDKLRLLHIGDEGMGLLSYSMLADDDLPLPINRSTVVTIFKPHREFEESYTSSTRVVDVVEKPGIIVP